ncbi:GspH/FimT family pseudopilin [Legionella maioricensis]|uniref:Type II secretion system protein H n=1 Tax=Legionella maioricensis TaxID=2896528 RepID=A0A9X2D319_9GAMM|nr:GspH/FimT family pseudopilin [Legionella maioricensis]MCL9685323.1 GspH/FimT family pseudopilin [Legionella maioricensis]MCL9688578.1 GspH/FimT family pseudopilin [Legionella maioricensis]
MNTTLDNIQKIRISDADNTLSNRSYTPLSPSQNNIAQNIDGLFFRVKKQTIPKMIFGAGFTLIELMITLSVLCLLLVVAVPSFRTMILNNRLNANSESLVNALSYARSTALYQAMNVVVCPFGAANSTACGANWNSGWIVVTQPAAGVGTLLKSQQASPTDPLLTSNVASVVFDSHGIATTQSNFKLCDDRGGAFARSVEVLATGFVQSGNTPGQAVWDNSALTCP